MKVHDYVSSRGEKLIEKYLDSLTAVESTDGFATIRAMEEDRFEELKTFPWRGKIQEVYFYKHNRIFYIIVDGKDIYLLHACHKQKNKTEKKESSPTLRTLCSILDALEVDVLFVPKES